MSQTAEPDRPLRADARRNRERILAAAKQLLAEAGADAQMDDIARRAGVGVGTLYRHFPTKDELLGALLKQKFVELKARAERHLELDDPWEGLTGMLRESALAMEHDVGEQRVLWQLTAESFAIAQPAHQELTEVGERLVARAHAAGVLRRDFEAAHIPTMMCGIGAAIAAQELPGPAGHGWRDVLEFLLAGLRAPGADAPTG
ncbi:TetR/AcrR family transcriptional regulator [Conexibacter sp. SYSU D00693]|uniref:TetR/AcrR family transcriptional regulator n=1 Tax=Conexibacter sp. SYSU D00693 TaxID=2812560 RepID=UPI00196B906A|nr:TetR/AcrR family transcriptional regulator [Conexibacter sp. SYSU D00693]